jgi:acyl transferase domain-containing protein
MGLEVPFSLSLMNFFSNDSRSYSFDHRANGYGRGEGFGVIVMKRLSDALRDGNTIRAVVRATASNQDGRTPGITQPSRDAQERLIRKTYEKAHLDLGWTRYVEAHGTGTPVSYSS